MQENTTRQVMNEILRMIRTRGMKPHDRLLSERDMAERFEVSRASVREALSALKILGVIEIRRGGGAFLADFTMEQLMSALSPFLLGQKDISNDVIQFRKMLEIGAVRLAAKQQEFTQLELIVEEMRAEVLSNSGNAEKLDVVFHKEIYRLSQNEILIKAMECVEWMLNESVSFNRNKIFSQTKDLRFLTEQHARILEAMKAHDEDLAAERMRTHLNIVTKINNGQ